MAQNGAPTHEIERQGRWKQGEVTWSDVHRRLIRRVGTTVFIIDVKPRH